MKNVPYEDKVHVLEPHVVQRLNECNLKIFIKACWRTPARLCSTAVTSHTDIIHLKQ